MSTKSEILQNPGNFINGEWLREGDPKQEIESVNPGDLSDTIGRFPSHINHVELAVKSARQAFARFKRTTLEERIELLQKYKSVIQARSEEMATLICREVGKPLWEARTEVKGMIGKVDLSIQAGMQLTQDVEIENILPGVKGAYRHRPLGVMSVIGPFNFPAHLPNGHIVPALLYGNTVVFKPSEKTPGVGLLMADFFREAGFAPGVFNLVQGSRDISKALVSHPQVHGVLFTGSYPVGKAIKQATIDQPWKILALEMGGINSAIVHEDANLDQALAETITGAFLTTGQRCSATSRILIHESLYEEFSKEFVSKARQIEIGNPMEEVFMGPLIDCFSRQSFLGAMEQAREEGFEILLEASELNPGKDGFYVSPLICKGSANLEKMLDSTFLQTEVFGPAVTLIPYSSLEDAMTLANASDYGLVCSVFTASESVFQECWHEVETGLVNWNKSTVGASSKLPFGGLKASGNFFPTAVTAGKYCSYPVTSMEGDVKAPGNWNYVGISSPERKES